MKKIIKKIFVIIMIIVILTIIIGLGIFGYKKIKNNSSIKTKEISNDTSEVKIEKTIDIDYSKTNSTEQKDSDIKIDNNPITLGLYTQSNSGKTLTKNFSSNWSKDEIIGMFYTVYTNKATISGNSFTSVWTTYYNEYSNIEKYKIGYNIKYTLKNGDIIDKQILKPDDVPSLFVNLQVYLYDDVTPMPGRRYYHMTQPEVTDKTIYTSIKIVAYKETVNVVSPIELTAFTYDGIEDFDKITGKYTGKSLYKTTITRK